MTSECPIAPEHITPGQFNWPCQRCSTRKECIALKELRLRDATQNADISNAGDATTEAVK
jgi:hypothetical protein